MRPKLILIVFCAVLVSLVAAPPAEAGPVRSAGRLAVQAAARAATLPLKAAGAVRSNRKAARQGRRATP